MNIVSFSQELAQHLYSSTEQFPVDFDDAWVWLEFSTKGNAKRSFEKSGFVKDTDYTVIIQDKRVEGNNGGGSTRFEQIKLTCECFKTWGMMSGTSKGKIVRQYFLQCEELAKLAVKPKSAIELLEYHLAIAKEHEQRLLALEAENQRLKQLQEQTEYRLEIVEADSEVVADRLEAVEVEQDRYATPCGHKYSVLGYAKMQGLEISAGQASAKGRKASILCRQRSIEVGHIYDPRFGKVGLYPESVLVEVFA